MLPDRERQGTLQPHDLDRPAAAASSSLYTLHKAHPRYVDAVPCVGDEEEEEAEAEEEHHAMLCAGHT